MIRWAQPPLLWAVLAVVPIGLVAFALLRRRGRLLGRIAAAELLPALLPRRKPARLRRLLLLWLAATALCLVAPARPQWGFQWQEVRRRGLDLLVVLDTSNSMLAEDIKPNRFQQAKWGLRDLVRRLHGDRIGLMAFAGSSFLQCPLTVDYAAFLMTLDDLYVGIIPRGGTAITQALRKAMDNFPDDRQADRAIVLVTDGEDHEGDPLSLLDELKARHIRVYAVGVGTPEGSPIPGQADQATGYLKDKQGRIVNSTLKEDVLAKLALGTGGAYVRSAPADFGLDRLYDQGIAKLKRDEKESRMAKAYEERFPWFLGAGLALFALEALLTGERRRR